MPNRKIFNSFGHEIKLPASANFNSHIKNENFMFGFPICITQLPITFISLISQRDFFSAYVIIQK